MNKQHLANLARTNADASLHNAWKHTNSKTTESRILRDKIVPMPQRKLTFKPHRESVCKKQYSET